MTTQHLNVWLFKFPHPSLPQLPAKTTSVRGEKTFNRDLVIKIVQCNGERGEGVWTLFSTTLNYYFYYAHA
jgi:subtilisin-like proprotein convertase family protein